MRIENELADFELLLKHCSKLDAGGKPSTWLPPGRLVEQFQKANIAKTAFGKLMHCQSLF